MYQCLAYAAAAGLPRITLLYNDDRRSARDVIVADGRTTVQVRTVDLAASADLLRSQFLTIAAEIVSELRQASAPAAIVAR